MAQAQFYGGPFDSEDPSTMIQYMALSMVRTEHRVIRRCYLGGIIRSSWRSWNGPFDLKVLQRWLVVPLR